MVQVQFQVLLGLVAPLTGLCSLQKLPPLVYGSRVKMLPNQVPLLPGETTQLTGTCCHTAIITLHTCLLPYIVSV